MNEVLRQPTEQSKKGDRNPRGIQVISRAAEVLRALEGKPEGLSLGEIAKVVELPRSTVQRIVGALATEKFVIGASPRAKVRLGPGLVSLGSAAKLELGRVVHPYLERLSGEVQETVDLSMLDGDMVIFIDQVASITYSLQAVSAIGVAFSLHCCAPGKAILASMGEEDLESHLNKNLEAQSANTITSKRVLRKELEEIRKTGIAYDREEQSLGINAIGMRVADSFGRDLAISIPVPSVRFPKKEKELIRALQKYVAIINRALGKGA